jgi:hypothetical protein
MHRVIVDAGNGKILSSSSLPIFDVVNKTRTSSEGPSTFWEPKQIDIQCKITLVRLFFYIPSSVWPSLKYLGLLSSHIKHLLMLLIITTMIIE